MSAPERDIAEMKRLLSVANYAKVGRALGVKRQVVSEWANGRDVNPTRLEQVRALMQRVAGKTRRNAPAEAGAAEELLARWLGDEPPPWSDAQVGKIIEEIRQDREAAMLMMAREIGRMTAEQLQELLRRLPDESSQEVSGQ